MYNWLFGNKPKEYQSEVEEYFKNPPKSEMKPLTKEEQKQIKIQNQAIMKELKKEEQAEYIKELGKKGNVAIAKEVEKQRKESKRDKQKIEELKKIEGWKMGFPAKPKRSKQVIELENDLDLLEDYVKRAKEERMDTAEDHKELKDMRKKLKELRMKEGLDAPTDKYLMKQLKIEEGFKKSKIPKEILKDKKKLKEYVKFLEGEEVEEGLKKKPMKESIIEDVFSDDPKIQKSYYKKKEQEEEEKYQKAMKEAIKKMKEEQKEAFSDNPDIIKAYYGKPLSATEKAQALLGLKPNPELMDGPPPQNGEAAREYSLHRLAMEQLSQQRRRLQPPVVLPEYVPMIEKQKALPKKVAKAVGVKAKPKPKAVAKKAPKVKKEVDFKGKKGLTLNELIKLNREAQKKAILKLKK